MFDPNQRPPHPPLPTYGQHAAQPPQEPSAAQPQPRGKLGRILRHPVTWGLAAVAVLASVTAVFALANSDRGGGGVPLVGEDTVELTIGIVLMESGAGDCSGGARGYDDLEQGMPVTVEDEKGEIIASTSLPGTGTESGNYDGCVWVMEVEVPEDRKQYAVTAGRRGTVTFEHDELVSRDWEAVVSMGDDT